MNETRGWILLHKKIRNSPEWLKKKFTAGQAWIDLLLYARNESWTAKLKIEGREVRIPLEAGQILTSQLKLGKRWRWGIGSVNRKLLLWKKWKRITLKTENKFTLITIVNWRKYQSPERKMENRMEKNGNVNGKQNGNIEITYKKEQQLKPSAEAVALISSYKQIHRQERGFCPQVSAQEEVAAEVAVKGRPIAELKEQLSLVIPIWRKIFPSARYNLKTALTSPHAYNAWQEERWGPKFL